MSQPNNRILTKMLERLFASLANGPSLNCKPHSSRQRIDLVQFSKLQDVVPEDLLKNLLSDDRAAKVLARVPAPRRAARTQPAAREDSEPSSPQEKAADQAWTDQQSVIAKVRTITEDARNYENDTGVHVLQIGFPLLSLPPGTFGLQRSFTRRILAPIAFISVTLTLGGGTSPAVNLECKGDGEELIVPNTALIAWLEQQTGKPAATIFSDEDGTQPWDELVAIVQRVAQVMELQVPPQFAQATVLHDELKLEPAPRSEEVDARPAILPTAILGLFPSTNQGLLRDLQAMVAGEQLAGPVQSFVNIDARLLDAPVVADEPPSPVPKRSKVFGDQRLISAADPCQARAVALARTSRGLVIHGPPGTGKSQTITNIIGDHLCRDQRVLLVCDKRTALDVVKNRLDSLGLGHLCAVVHDPRRDQRELYKSIHEQLDGLAAARTNASAEGQLAKVDAELETLHKSLGEYYASLMDGASAGSGSFHMLMGQWLAVPSIDSPIRESELQGVTPDMLDQQSHALDEIFQRARSADYPPNPWTPSAGISLETFLSTPMDHFRESMASIVESANKSDATIDPAIPAFAAGISLETQGRKRAELVEPLKRLFDRIDRGRMRTWAEKDARALQKEKQKLADVAPLIELLRAGPLDAELWLGARSRVPSLADIAGQITALNEYLAIAARWYSLFCFGQKSAARHAMAPYALTLNIENARRLAKFLSALRARLLLQALHCELLAQTPAELPDDEMLDAGLADHALLFDILIRLATDPDLSSVQLAFRSSLPDPNQSAQLIAGLQKSPTRAAALQDFETQLHQTGLLAEPWLAAFNARAREGKPAADTITGLSEHLDSLEGVLRVRQGLASQPPVLRAVVIHLIDQRIDPEQAILILKKAVLSLQIAQRLKSDTSLQGMDAQKVRSNFDRYRLLEQQKRNLVRQTIIHRWVARQKDRLLATTGSRLNSQGADLRRRLTIRGQRAMRLRQVVAAGQETEGGDPLFDLRPVWMVSPETAAQIFPRKSQFEVIIFDEASQCRLEEALPVLTRGARLVVAGDTKQLPPTRFFETAVAASEDEEIESDQQLFESQQGEVEDLLGAALNVEIEECYLDVHYRSRNADLIEFSNQHFYNSRLQSIPGHPANRGRFAPLTLYAVNGIYDKHCNAIEADQVCKIVGDLLRRSNPPSIGIACFNLPQRDLIVEKLDALAADDPEFAHKLADARNRKGPASFEGLFVRNLENVQGDERDHIIISTTYGPDPRGKFYRRFGPLARAGGGRRLNVLVTRAREEVHVITSIPRNHYTALPPIPPGETPGGAWLLFGYLSYAEQLAETYETNHRILSQQDENAEKATVNVRPSQWPSPFSVALGQRLAGHHKVGSDVHWGNDGFCVDLALHHPRRIEDVTIGILCDLTRFAQAEDPVEWEIFRTSILESQGWRLHRLFTPHFYRDRHGCTQGILKDITEFLATEEEKDAIRVVPNQNLEK